MVFHCHVSVRADGLVEELCAVLSFDQILEEIFYYYPAKSAEESKIEFNLYPFLDDCSLGHYSLHLYHPDYVHLKNRQIWMSLPTLQMLL